MPSLLIKNIPPRLHRRLKEESKRHRRSMMQEAIVILEESLDLSPVEFPEPARAAKKITRAMLTEAIRDGRE